MIPDPCLPRALRPLRLAACLVLGFLASHGAPSPDQAVPESLPSTHLHNLHRISPRIFSGSSPDDDDAFAELKRLGVTTIVSVDGARPDVEGAARHGLRYLHLPIGYDGISSERQAQLVLAAKSAPGRVYLHCHHGKHRGPAAAALVCQSTEGWSGPQAVTWLQKAGTSPEYPGLYRSVQGFRPPSDAMLQALAPLPEVTTTSSLVEAMVEIDTHAARLQAAKSAGWTQVPGHPDLEPRQVATLLREHFRELLRTPETTGKPEDYREGLRRSEVAAERLHQALVATPPDTVQAEKSLQELGRLCSACHKAHRNAP